MGYGKASIGALTTHLLNRPAASASSRAFSRSAVAAAAAATASRSAATRLRSDSAACAAASRSACFLSFSALAVAAWVRRLAVSSRAAVHRHCCRFPPAPLDRCPIPSPPRLPHPYLCRCSLPRFTTRHFLRRLLDLSCVVRHISAGHRHVVRVNGLGGAHRRQWACAIAACEGGGGNSSDLTRSGAEALEGRACGRVRGDVGFSRGVHSGPRALAELFKPVDSQHRAGGLGKGRTFPLSLAIYKADVVRD